MTPRQLVACMELAQRRQSRDDAKTLAINTLGAQGKVEEVNKRITEWSK